MDALMQELKDSGFFSQSAALSTYAVPNDNKRITTEYQIFDSTKVYDKVYSQYMNQDRLLVTLDWLQIRLTDSLENQLYEFKDDILDLQPYRLELLEGGTTQFKYRANVFYGLAEKSKLIGVIQFGARQHTLRGSMIIQYNNTVFYDRELFTVYSRSVFDGLFKSLNCKYLNVTRADIAFDGVDFSTFLKEYVECRWTEIGYKNFYPRDYDIHNKCHKDFHVGSKRGNKYIRYYNKLAELDFQEKKGTPKQYIKEYFLANGFDLSKGVFRFELRLKSKAFKDLENFKFQDLLYPPSMCAIVEEHCKNWFEFVPTDHTDSVISRRPRLQMFDFSKIAKKEYVRVKRKIGAKIRTVKIMVKRLLNDAYQKTEKESVFLLKTASELVNDYYLLDWITSKSKFYLQEFSKAARAQGIPPNPLFNDLDGLGGLMYDWQGGGDGYYIQYDKLTGETITENYNLW